ncbi:enoyl-CoA hydratase/isomerase family protein [Streptomyces sp. NPDC051018]|uniref:enoyl-CoA hydratase/isomerase family protein n=1 Tax=Streptomyces sp. NPDC051018 TaxID=3365639 RepID=UPI0037AB1642
MNDVLVEKNAPGVAEIILNRPSRRNALTFEMLAEFRDRLSDVLADDEVTTILLRGAGGCFCSGLDLGAIDPNQVVVYPPLRAVHELLAGCDKAVVVALELAAVNAGAAFALSGDLIVAGDGAFLQTFELSMGFRVPMNLAWLTSRYGSATALQIVLEGRRWHGPDLYRLGIAVQHVPDEEVLTSAWKLAARLGAFPKGSIEETKATARALRGPLAAPAVFARLD